MDWAKKNYDTLILAACTLLLALNGAYFYFQSEGFLPSLPSAPEGKQTKIIATAQETESLAQACVMIDNPILWNEKSLLNQKERGNLFVSRSYILKGDKLIDPIEGGEDLHSPITNAWLIKFGLNYADATIKDQDQDQDGFNNLEEYEAKSDPLNKASTPPKFKKLKFVKFEQKDFPVIFKGDAGNDGIELHFGKVKFTTSRSTGSSDPDIVLGTIDLNGIKYNVRSYKKREYPVDLPSTEKNKYDELFDNISKKIDQDEVLKQLTEDIMATGRKLKLSEDSYESLKKSKTSQASLNKVLNEVELYKKQIRDFRNSSEEIIKTIWLSVDPSFEKYRDTPKKDLSEVIFTNTLTGESITLVKGIPTPDPTSIGEFFNVLVNEKFRLQKGEEFTMKPDANTKLKLIDISSTEAMIQDIATGKTEPLKKSSSSTP